MKPLLPRFSSFWVAFLLTFLVSSTAWAELIIWHAYRGAEEEALKEVVKAWNAQNAEDPARLLAVPYDAFANKLTSAIPRGNGPDVFIAAHERVGDWSRSGLLEPLSGDIKWETYHPITVDALTVDGTRFAVPLAYKSVVLFYNLDLIAQAPKDTDELIARAREHTGNGSYGLAYQAGNFYMHAPWLFGFGGEIFDEKGDVNLANANNVASVEFARSLVQDLKIVPEESTGALVTQLFNEGKAAFVINGPWFLGEIAEGVNYAMAPLPTISATGNPAKPFLTVDAAFVSKYGTQKETAANFAVFMAEHSQAVTRATSGLQPVATLSAYEAPEVQALSDLKVFRQQLDASVPMPNNPKMRAVWEPAETALRQVMRGAATPDEALKAADRRVTIFTRESPPPANPIPTIIFMSLVLMGVLGWTLKNLDPKRTYAAARKNKAAYLYVAPAMVAMLVLVVTPFLVGSAVSLFSHVQGEFTFVGLANFWSILTSKEFGITDPLSFYYTLAVTVLWTVLNVFLHVTIGLGMALMLRNPWLRLKGVYRVLLIVPWAVPNYITALIWRGMFHKQFGAINGILGWFGVEPVSWFSQFATSFAANLATNVWLGFPFMMVVTLGALQAIPKDLEEAAEVDGASRWQRFRHITLPLLRPALVPAIVLGTVWTFNAFNVIYLVSMGEPDGATEILISEAYKWAFARQEQYGYASAYAVLIFLVLLFYSAFTGQLKTDD
ncbi:extracellular solute-binding protein [Microvenator marinus]|uniref:extracellular solute-binding protein n=1 Tax=Microvenator marinus TaxID=2600177 RepID=UPI00201B4CCE|nr:extracellular solute-binding protein [Microvenator marinus]